jgi:hypothetical protein
MTIEVSTTDRRDGKALALFARHDEWMRGHTKDGRSFFAIPGSQAGLLHMADQNDCSCADRQRSRNVCKHQRAVRLWMAAFMTGAVAPKREAASMPLDDRIVLLPRGAAALVALDSECASADVAITVPEHPQVAQLREMLARRVRVLNSDGTTPDEYRQDADYTAIEARLLDTEAQIAATAARRTTYSALFGADDDDPFCPDCNRHHLRGQHYGVYVA